MLTIFGGGRMKREEIRAEEKQRAEERKRHNKELEANPLIQFSTTQLKAEIRRRKNERN